MAAEKTGTGRGLRFDTPQALAAGALLSCALWGSAIPFVRLGYALLGISASDTGSQLLFAGVRFFLAGLAVLVASMLASGRRRLPDAAEAGAAAKIALFQTFGQYLFYYIGLAHSTGVNGALSQGVDVFASLIIAGAVFRMEKLTPMKLLGALIGFAGIFIADGGGGSPTFTFIGEGLIMLGTVSSALAAVLTRRYAQDMDAIMLCAWQFMLGGAALAAVGLGLGGRLSIGSWEAAGVLAWLVIVSAVGYGVWSLLLRDNDVSRVSVWTFTLPIFGVLLSLLILGNEGAAIGPSTFVALALVSLGILIVEKAPAD